MVATKIIKQILRNMKVRFFIISQYFIIRFSSENIKTTPNFFHYFLIVVYNYNYIYFFHIYQSYRNYFIILLIISILFLPGSQKNT